MVEFAHSVDANGRVVLGSNTMATMRASVGMFSAQQSLSAQGTSPRSITMMMSLSGYPGAHR